MTDLSTTTSRDDASDDAAVSIALDAATRRARLCILIGAGASFLFSVTLWFSGAREEGLFVGLWVPSILALGSVVLPVVKQE